MLKTYQLSVTVEVVPLDDASAAAGQDESVVLFGRRTGPIVADGRPAAHIRLMTTTIHASATSCPTPTPAPARPRPLLDHQVPAVADAVNGLADTTRGQVIMACGTGKTVVAQRIAETLAGDRR